MNDDKLYAPPGVRAFETPEGLVGVCGRDKDPADFGVVVVDTAKNPNLQALPFVPLDDRPASTVPRTRYQELLIDGIVGAGLPGYAFAQQMEAGGFARFTGNQHNPEWAWERFVLERMTEQELLELYVQIKTIKGELV